MQLSKLIEKIDAVFPPDTAMDGDRTGLQIQSGRSDASKLMFAYELTAELADEAQMRGADCIVAFHPLIYSPLRSLTDADRVGYIVTRLVQAGIALITVHTRFDVFSLGTSRILSDLFGMDFSSFLIPDAHRPNFGMGVIGTMREPVRGNDLVRLVSETLGSPVRFTEGKNEPIEKIAIVGGSGTSFIAEAIGSGAQAFITADTSYHRFHDVKGKLWLIDPGHYEMEQFTAFAMAATLRDCLGCNDLEEIMIAECYTNPVRYFPDTDKYITMQNQILNNYIR